MAGRMPSDVRRLETAQGPGDRKEGRRQQQCQRAAKAVSRQSPQKAMTSCKDGNAGEEAAKNAAEQSGKYGRTCRHIRTVASKREQMITERWYLFAPSVNF